MIKRVPDGDRSARYHHPRVRNSSAAERSADVGLISAITTCKARLEHLKQTLPTLLAMGMEVVVVDYDCPDRAGAWVRDNCPQARVVEVSDRPYFSPSTARNRGAAAAGEWLVFLDADVSAAPAFVAAVRGLIQPDVFLIADPRPRGLWDALVVARRDFDAVGGYDEVFEGWGDEDVELTARLAIGGVRQASFPARFWRRLATATPSGRASIRSPTGGSRPRSTASIGQSRSTLRSRAFAWS
jgi:hypothetical protein